MANRHWGRLIGATVWIFCLFLCVWSRRPSMINAPATTCEFRIWRAATAAATANIKMKTKTNLLPTQVHTEQALAQGQVAQSHARYRRRRLMDFTRCLATNDGYLWLSQLAASVVWVAHHSNRLQSLALPCSLTLPFPLSLTVSASSVQCQKPNKRNAVCRSAEDCTTPQINFYN